MTEDEVKAELTRRLGGRPPREAIWSVLIEKRYVKEVMGADEPKFRERTLTDLEREYKRLAKMIEDDKRSAERSPRRQTGRENRSRITRKQSLAEIVEREAMENPSVRQFRREVLGGVLLAPHEVQDWLDHAERAQGQHVPGLSLEIEVPGFPGDREVTAEWLQEVLIEHPEAADKPVAFRYENQRGLYPMTVGVRLEGLTRGGVLHRLADLSNDLAAVCGWSQAAAAGFILTGYLLHDYPEFVAWLTPHEHQALSRISMSVGAWCPPEKVAGHFRRAVRRFTGTTPSGRKRHQRQLKERTLQLAPFGRPLQGSTWSERLRQWNELVRAIRPDWRFLPNDTRRFSRQAVDAFRRVTGQVKS